MTPDLQTARSRMAQGLFAAFDMDGSVVEETDGWLTSSEQMTRTFYIRSDEPFGTGDDDAPSQRATFTVDFEPGSPRALGCYAVESSTGDRFGELNHPLERYNTEAMARFAPPEPACAPQDPQHAAEVLMELDGGKYTIVMEGQRLKALRDGKPWRDLAGDELFASLVEQVRQLNEQVKRAQFAGGDVTGIRVVVDASKYGDYVSFVASNALMRTLHEAAEISKTPGVSVTVPVDGAAWGDADSEDVKIFTTNMVVSGEGFSVVRAGVGGVETRLLDVDDFMATLMAAHAGYESEVNLCSPEGRAAELYAQRSEANLREIMRA